MLNFKKGFILLIIFLMFFSCINLISAAENVNDYENVNDIFELLQNENVNCTSISLDKDYVFDREGQIDQTGIVINKEGLEIDGQGHTIDANGRSRIFVVNAKNVVLKNINFINGNATNGGALLVNENAENLKIYDCKFENNYADIGGAIDCHAIRCDVTGCNFENNTAGLGGAICSQDNGIHRVAKCKFCYNHAKEGGAIYVTGYSVLSLCRFDNNIAEIGGAIRINQTYPLTFNLSQCTFTNNAGNDGEAIYSNSNITTFCQIFDCHDLIFAGNAKSIDCKDSPREYIIYLEMEYKRFLEMELAKIC